MVRTFWSKASLQPNYLKCYCFLVLQTMVPYLVKTGGEVGGGNRSELRSKPESFFAKCSILEAGVVLSCTAIQ